MRLGSLAMVGDNYIGSSVRSDGDDDLSFLVAYSVRQSVCINGKGFDFRNDIFYLYCSSRLTYYTAN